MWYCDGVTNLAQKRCIPCEGGALPLSREDSEKLLREVSGWELSVDSRAISRQYTFKNFVDAMNFANKITPIAEGEGHHPDLSIGWGKVRVELTTHAMSGLSENDFIVAAKINEISA